MSLEALSNAASLQEPLYHSNDSNGDNKMNNSSGDNSSRTSSRSSNNGDVPPTLPSIPLPRQPVIDAQIPVIPSAPRPHAVRIVDWARQVTLEERKFIRDKIKVAYKRKASSYEDLLEVCCAIEEELIFGLAPSRLDYFKSGVQFEKRVAEKLSQIKSGFIAGVSCSDNKPDDGEKAIKRSKTQL